jgi:hypothetical protein
MSDFRYSDIERQLVDALPEIRPAAEFYWRTEGEPGQDCGAYIFFEDLFARYVEVLLALPSSARRDELLRRAFGKVEEMLGSADDDVRDLATIGLYEGRSLWWFKRATPFVGPLATTWLDTFQAYWRDSASSDDRLSPEILDGYHVRSVIARELRQAGLPADEIPGTTYAKGSLPDMTL